MSSSIDSWVVRMGYNEGTGDEGECGFSVKKESVVEESPRSKWPIGQKKVRKRPMKERGRASVLDDYEMIDTNDDER